MVRFRTSVQVLLALASIREWIEFKTDRPTRRMYEIFFSTAKDWQYRNRPFLVSHLNCRKENNLVLKPLFRTNPAGRK